MTTYGYTIINTLVTDIDPDIQVKNAMNRIMLQTARKQSRNLKQKHQELELLQKQKQKQKVNAYKDRYC
jgi:phosphopantothenoylcysteine synthetase/decarboxylase